jgi:hypothetical protein
MLEVQAAALAFLEVLLYELGSSLPQVGSLTAQSGRSTAA